MTTSTPTSPRCRAMFFPSPRLPPVMTAIGWLTCFALMMMSPSTEYLVDRSALAEGRAFRHTVSKIETIGHGLRNASDLRESRRARELHTRGRAARNAEIARIAPRARARGGARDPPVPAHDAGRPSHAGRRTDARARAPSGPRSGRSRGDVPCAEHPAG